jgi:hypothetical protein
VRRWLARASVFLSVVAYWLGAAILWSFGGGLAVHYGLLATYNGAVFGLVAAIGGVCHYRVQARAGYQRGLAVFVGAQLAWLAVVLFQNGAFGNVW